MNAEARWNMIIRIGSRVPFNKAQAAEFVGGRYRLEKLIAEKKIRAEKKGPTRMSPYEVNASDVFLYAKEPKEQRI